MSISKREIIATLESSAEQIRLLRDRLNWVQIENNAYDRILSALEAHNPKPRAICDGEDQAYAASQLAKKLEVEFFGGNK